MLADSPYLLAMRVLLAQVANARRRPGSDPHAHDSKARRGLALSATPPAHRLPRGTFEHIVSGARRAVGYMVLAWPPVTRDWKDHRSIGRTDLLLVGYANRTGETARGECMSERGGYAKTGLGKDAAEADTILPHAVDLDRCDLRV